MQEFHSDKPIFLQIADRIMDEILAGNLIEDARIPSVRDYATLLQVNTNTAVKAYDELSRANIIYQRRGMGYYVCVGAPELIRNMRRQRFLEVTVPQFFHEMELLGLSLDDIKDSCQV